MVYLKMFTITRSKDRISSLTWTRRNQWNPVELNHSIGLDQVRQSNSTKGYSNNDTLAEDSLHMFQPLFFKISFYY